MSASPNFPGLPPNWTEHTEMLDMNGQKLLYREFRRQNAPPRDRPSRRLYLVHGFGEQSDRFLHFPHYLHTCLDAIAIVDLPGHGKSTGQRGYIPHFNLLADAVLCGFHHFVGRTDSWIPHSQTHWFGASMGGLTTLRTMFRQVHLPLKSVIVTEAQLGIAVPVPWIKEKFAELAAPFLGKLALGNEIAASALSHDVSVQEEYVKNKGNHDRITPHTFLEMKKEMADLQYRLEKQEAFPYSLLMIVPLADEVVSPQKQMDFFQRVTLGPLLRKSLQTFPYFRHEAFNEIGKERPFLALENWLQSFH